ncbi:MAG: DUF2892 domain-containing protein [Pseudomonadota bacterium]
MITNMGKIDRGARLAVVAGLLFLAFGTSVLGSGILFWLALAVAAVFTLTSLVGNCPLYRIIGLKTCSDC